MEHKTGFEIIPTFDYHNQTLTFTEESHGFMDKVIKQQIDFKEECVRKALIALGWTPPNSSSSKD